MLLQHLGISATPSRNEKFVLYSEGEFMAVAYQDRNGQVLLRFGDDDTPNALIPVHIDVS